MAVELSARVGSPIKLKTILEELYVICKQLNLVFDHHLQIALLLAITYAKSAETKIVDDALILKEKRVLNARDLIDKIKSKDSDSFICYSIKLCRKLGIHF